jgi:rubredoxin
LSDRCVLCDYVDGHGSELHDIAPRKRIRVLWNSQHNEYQCTACMDVIKDVTHQWEIEDELEENGWDEEE